MRIIQCLCAAVALGVIACCAANGYASEPNRTLKEKVALRMASASGSEIVKDSADKEIGKGKVTLRKAKASGKYAQGVLALNFGLNDDSEATQEELNKAQSQLDETKRQMDEVRNQINSRDPNANAIKWYTPTNLKKGGSGGQGQGGQGSGGQGDGGWIDCWDPVCCCACCCCCSCQSSYPYVISTTGCGYYETGCDFGGCDYIDDCSCSFDCAEICEPGRACLAAPVLKRVVGRIRALR